MSKHVGDTAQHEVALRMADGIQHGRIELRSTRNGVAPNGYLLTSKTGDPFVTLTLEADGCDSVTSFEIRIYDTNGERLETWKTENGKFNLERAVWNGLQGRGRKWSVINNDPGEDD